MDMTGASREGIHFNIIGTNYKLTNIQAAVGLGQLENIEELLNVDFVMKAGKVIKKK